MSLKNYFLPSDNLLSIQKWPVVMISALKAKQKQTIKSFVWIYAAFQPLIKLSRGCWVSRLFSGPMAQIQSKSAEVKSASPNWDGRILFLELRGDSQCQNPLESRAPCSCRRANTWLNIAEAFVCSVSFLPSEKFQAAYMRLAPISI